MTDKEQISALKEQVKKLQAENRSLHQQNADKENDIKEISILLYKTLKALGLSKDVLANADEAQSKVLLAIPQIATKAFSNPDGLADDFSHLAEFQPLFDKYEYLIKEIADE